MGSSPPVCSFTASLIQVAHVGSRCATIIYMNGIENFLLRGGEKRHERVRSGEGRHGRREGGGGGAVGGRRRRRTKERDGRKGTRDEEEAERNSEEERESDREGRVAWVGCGGKERAKIFWHFMSVIT